MNGRDSLLPSGHALLGGQAHPMIVEGSLSDWESLFVVHGWRHPEPCRGAVSGLARVLTTM